MLLQTIVQLNILLFAAPALAGWAVLPPSHPLLVQAVRRTCLPAVQEKVERQTAPKAMPRPAGLRLTVWTDCREQATQLSKFPRSAEPSIVSVPAFPHAARAP